MPHLGAGVGGLANPTKDRTRETLEGQSRSHEGQYMKNHFILTFCGLLLAFALGQAAHAQTPHGQTLAEETDCDPLKADGITKGLYGLCVAFCEAQDHASLSAPITAAELEALEDGIPSGKILANYNEKKVETDPPMPCIKVEESCPCWTEEQFLTVSQQAFDSDLNNNVCSDNWDGNGTLHYMWSVSDPQKLVLAHEDAGSMPFCFLWDGAFQQTTYITYEELGSCRDRIIARQQQLGLTPSSTIMEKPYCLNKP